MCLISNAQWIIKWIIKITVYNFKSHAFHKCHVHTDLIYRRSTKEKCTATTTCYNIIIKNRILSRYYTIRHFFLKANINLFRCRHVPENADPSFFSFLLTLYQLDLYYICNLT